MSPAPLGSTQSISTLLQEVYPGPRFTEGYLRWLYESSPEGPRTGADHLEAQRVLGHYPVIPQVWRAASEIHRLGLIANLAVSKNAARKGIANILIRLSRAAHDSAREAGVEAVYGVANANSTPGLIGRMRFTRLGALPVIAGMVLPHRAKGAQSFALDAGYLEGPEFEKLAASVDSDAEDGYARAWTPENLRWRLSSPLTPYALHASENGILVSCATVHMGARIIVALKYMRRRGARSVDARRLLAMAAGFHGTPFFIYAGFNRHVRPFGIPLPRRILPSPLNLLYLPLVNSMPSGPNMRFSTFEFLDFDAY